MLVFEAQPAILTVYQTQPLSRHHLVTTKNTKLLSRRFYLMNMFLTLLMLIAIFLIDCTLGKAFDSQRNNEDIFRKDLRGMQLAKEMLSDRANIYTNPWKSETNDSSAFEHFSVPKSSDVPASSMSSFLSQLTAVPASSFLHFHIPTNATSTATGLTSLNDVTIAQVSAMTATTTATMTQVLATATTNAPKYQIDKCDATRTQHKTRSPSILHPAKKSANNATLNLLLPFNQDNSVIMISSLLLLHHSAHPAITTATNATFSLQLIVESFSTGAEQVAPATICNDSFKSIDTLASEGAQFVQIFYQLGNLDSSQLIVDLISVIWSFTNIIHGSFKPQNLIVIYFKRSLHFQEDCGTYCEGEWEQQWHLNGYTGLVDFQQRHLNGHTGLVNFIGLVGLIGFIGFIDFIGVVGLVGLNGLIRIVGLSCLNDLIGLVGFADHVGIVGVILLVDFIGIGLIGLVGLGLIGRFIGLIGFVGFVGVSLNCFIGFSIITISLCLARIDFEIGTKHSQRFLLVRESWLWGVRRVIFDSLISLWPDFCFEKALQNAKQLFFIRLQQMTKYFVMRECENIPRWISLCCDSAFAYKKEFSIFKFSGGFSEISWTKTSLYWLY
jgi:hypothetical protein